MIEPLAEEKIKCILECKEAGLNKREAAKKCGVSVSTVYKYWDYNSPKKNEVKDEGEVKSKERSSPRAGAGFSEVLKALGSEYSEIIKAITEKTRWFTDALVNIGWISTMMALQYARVDPKDISKKVEEFQDAGSFVEFVKKNLSAMVEASSDAVNAILERDKELSKYRNAVEMAKVLINVYRSSVKELIKQLEIAKNIITKYGLTEEYVDMLAQRNIVESLIQIPIQPQGEEGGKYEGTS